MTQSTEEHMKRIEQKKHRIRLQEQILRERERRIRAKRSNEIGRLAVKAGIDRLDSQVLLGAFLEIAERSQDPTTLSLWVTRSRDKKAPDEGVPIIVILRHKATAETKQILRRFNLRWNQFRKEYYGHANPNDVQAALKAVDHHLEILQ